MTFNDNEYVVKVVKLEPEDVVTIVETDLEVDINHSMEYEEHFIKEHEK